MAGSRMSPRQKMINMMYLVLTAILALNVSSEVLQAFESLRNSLADTANASATHNSGLAESIMASIQKEEQGGNTKHTHLKSVINEISAETNKMVSYLEGLSQELEVIGGKDLETGEIPRKDETNANYSFWMGWDDAANGGRGEGKALEMHTKLDQFIDWANKLLETNQFDNKLEFKNLIVEPADDPSIRDPESKEKTWEYHSFNQTPLIANLATVEKFKMDVRRIETEILNIAKNELDDYSIAVDSIFAFEAPLSQVVTAGMRYETKLLVGMASSSVQPEFFGNGISADPGGSTATMTINANGNVIPNGKSEGIQRYQAMIKVPKRDGTFMEMPISGQFIVKKPEVQVRSKELQLLYKDCGNTVVVDVPSLGDLYNPDFSKSTGGNIISNPTNKKEITIIPSARKFNLSVYTNTNGQNLKLDNLEYKVILPPKPRIALYSSTGQEYNGLARLNKRSKVIIKVLPDPEFKGTLGKDARYKADKVKLMILKGMGGTTEVKSYSGRNLMQGIEINLNQGAIRNALPGDKIFIEVEGLKRINFQGKSIDESLPRINRIVSGVLS